MRSPTRRGQFVHAQDIARSRSSGGNVRRGEEGSELAAGQDQGLGLGGGERLLEDLDFAASLEGGLELQRGGELLRRTARIARVGQRGGVVVAHFPIPGRARGGHLR